MSAHTKQKTKNRYCVGPQTTENDLEPHYQQDGRYFLIDSATGDRLNVSRLTAYAAFGEEIYGKVVHHEIPLLQIDAPRFLEPLTREEHAAYHMRNPDAEDVDGFPRFRTER